MRGRYTTLWDVLHAEPVFGFTDRYRLEGTIRRLNDLGFAVDELSLQPDGTDPTMRNACRTSPACASARVRPASCSPIQAYCDLLEVRWLLSEKASHDVGTNRALAALSRDVIPTDSAAKMAVAEIPTAPFAVLHADDE